jgi:hypothetical protein
MADDNTVRSYRSRDSHRRGADQGEAPDQPFGGGSDPLAELARLIGQNDPYTDNRRREPQATPSRSRYDDSNDWRRHVERPNYQARDEAPFDADARYGIADQDARYGSADQHPGYPDQHAGYADHDPYRMTSPQTDQQRRITPDTTRDTIAGTTHGTTPGTISVMPVASRRMLRRITTIRLAASAARAWSPPLS